MATGQTQLSFSMFSPSDCHGNYPTANALVMRSLNRCVVNSTWVVSGAHGLWRWRRKLAKAVLLEPQLLAVGSNESNVICFLSNRFCLHPLTVSEHLNVIPIAVG